MKAESKAPETELIAKYPELIHTLHAPLLKGPNCGDSR